MRVNHVGYLQNNQQVQSFTAGSMPVGNLERGLEGIRLKNANEDMPGKLRNIASRLGKLVCNIAYFGGIGTCLYEILTLPLHPEDKINKMGICTVGIGVAVLSTVLLSKTWSRMLNALRRH